MDAGVDSRPVESMFRPIEVDENTPSTTEQQSDRQPSPAEEQLQGRVNSLRARFDDQGDFAASREACDVSAPYDGILEYQGIARFSLLQDPSPWVKEQSALWRGGRE